MWTMAGRSRPSVGRGARGATARRGQPPRRPGVPGAHGPVLVPGRGEHLGQICAKGAPRSEQPNVVLPSQESSGQITADRFRERPKSRSTGVVAQFALGQSPLLDCERVHKLSQQRGCHGVKQAHESLVERRRSRRSE